MKVLVIGGGAREHALVWKLNKSWRVNELHAAPGNAGIAEIAQCHPDVTTLPALVELAETIGADLTVVGPETQLVDGVVDAFAARGLRVFGPRAAAAQIEGSKIWAKDVMNAAGIPTAAWRSFTEARKARAYAREAYNWRCVIKADSPARGRGSLVCTSEAEVNDALETLLVKRTLGNGIVLIEELLDGAEVSVFAITDGRTVYPFGAAQDHKRALDGNSGPNTGGMGAYSPVDHMRVAKNFADGIFTPLIAELAAKGAPFSGALYAGAILTEQGPKILEFNCRFGDPEAEVLFRRLESDLFEILWAATDGTLHLEPSPQWNDEEALCVVMAAEPYPDGSSHGALIAGLREAQSLEDVVVFHSGTARDEDGRLVTDGGRILTITAMGPDLKTARERAYLAVEQITFDGAYVRRDIGADALASIWSAEVRQPSMWQRRVDDAASELALIARELGRLSTKDRTDRAEVESDLLDRVQAVRLTIKSASEPSSALAYRPTSEPRHLLDYFDSRLDAMQTAQQGEAFTELMSRPRWIAKSTSISAVDTEHDTSEE